MTINNTLNYLLARQADVVLTFSAVVTTGSTYLKGAGGEAGDGYPLPRNALITRLDVWDGTGLQSGNSAVEAVAGDRIALFATHNGMDFDVAVRINGVESLLAATGVKDNATLMATLTMKLV